MGLLGLKNVCTNSFYHKISILLTSLFHPTYLDFDLLLIEYMEEVCLEFQVSGCALAPFGSLFKKRW